MKCLLRFIIIIVIQKSFRISRRHDAFQVRSMELLIGESAISCISMGILNRYTVKRIRSLEDQYRPRLLSQGENTDYLIKLKSFSPYSPDFLFSPQHRLVRQRPIHLGLQTTSVTSYWFYILKNRINYAY